MSEPDSARRPANQAEMAPHLVNGQDGPAAAALFGLASLDGETARLLAETHGTPAMRLEYALLKADRRLHDAEAAAGALAKAGGERLDVAFAYDAAHLAWTDEVEASVAAYALEHDVAARSNSSTDELASAPAGRGGTSLLAAYLMERGGGWEIGAWQDFVAGYNEGIQARAAAPLAPARAADQQALKDPAESQTAQSAAAAADTQEAAPGAQDQAPRGALEKAASPKVSEAAAKAAEIKAEAARHGLTVTANLSRDFNPATGEQDGRVIDATVTVEGTFTPGDARAYIAAAAAANTVLDMVRMVRPGSVWGTDSASVGGHAGLAGGYVRMNKSGAEIAVARHLATPPAGGGNPAPKTASARARRPGRRMNRQQVQPRTRGRHR